MRKTRRQRGSPARGTGLGALLAALLVAGFGGIAAASGPGSDGDDDTLEAVDADNSGSGSDSVDDIADVTDDAATDVADAVDNSGPGGGDDDLGDAVDEIEVADNSGPGGDDSAGSGGDDDNSGSGGGDDDDSDSRGGDDDNSGSGGGDDDNSGSDGGDDDNSGSGGGGDDDNSGSGDGGGDDDNSGGDGDNSGSGHSGSGSGSGGGDDDEGSGNSGSGSSGSSEGSSGGTSGSSSEHGLASNDGEYRAMAIEVDENGEERVAGEALLAGTQADVDAALEAGFTAISQTSLPSMDCAMVRLALPAGMSVEQAVAALKQIAPNALVTANAVYQHAEGSVSAATNSRHARAPAYRSVMGVIDTGVAVDALAPNGVISQRGFAGTPVSREHGEAVVALANAHGVRVQVADVFGDTTAGGQVASAESIAAALDWMIETRMPVINISIEGPNNALLQALVNRATERGHVIVAAAGNGGPMATPAFPAAFDRSVAITAIDGNDRPYVRANRGGYIDFAARGVNVRVQSGRQDLVVSGTSFATPLVAAQIAERMETPSPARATEILAELRQRAVDLGAPGRDPIFGWGAVRD